MQKRALTFLFVLAIVLLNKMRLVAGEPFQIWFKALTNEEPRFSTEELQTIQKGNIVSRARDDLNCPGKGEILFLQAYGTINLPPEECWKRLTNNLADLYQTQPLMVEVNPIKAAGPAILLDHTLSLIGKKYHYVNRYELQPQAHVITFILDTSRPYNVKDHFGYWRVRPWGNNMSLIEQGAYMDLGFKYKPPNWLMKQLSLIDFPNTIKQVRKYFFPH